MDKITLIIEKSDDGYVGRVTYEDDLIVAEESSLEKVENRIKKLLKQLHRVDITTIQFQEKYDLSSLFEKFDYLKISTIAKIAGLNDSLLRQYVTGNKHASENQAKKIETVIRQIGKDLMHVQVYNKFSSIQTTMDATKLTKDTLSFIISQSGAALEHFYNKNQDELVRFAFCALEKLHKVAKGINRLYPHLEEDEELEFSIGILVRSLMMDCLMVQHLKHTIFVEADKSPQPSKEELTITVKGICLKLINAGTNSLISDVYLSENLNDQQKSEIANKFASRFPKAFDLTLNRPKQAPGFQFTIKELYKESDHSALVTRDNIYNLYTFYSKYDHLSDWTSLAKQIPFDHRKGKIDLSIMLVMNELRDLLALVSDFDPNYSALKADALLVHDALQSLKEFDNVGDQS